MAEAIEPVYLPAILPGDLPDLAVATAHSGLALMLYGSPGIGKTALVQALGTERRLVAWASQRCGQALDTLGVVTLSAPELNVEDLLGVPTVEELVRRLPDGGDHAFKVTRWATPAALDPTRPFVLFIDEPNRCDPSVRNALFQLITGRTTSGGFSLPKGSVVCMAGNRLEDRAGVRSMDTAFSNRCAHFELKVDHEAWLDWAGSQKGFSPLVRAFLARHPGYLNHFDPQSPSPQQPTPRTWAGVGFALPCSPERLKGRMVQAAVGVEAAQLFQAFQAHAEVVPEASKLLENPEGVRLPSQGQLDQAWILGTALADHLTVSASVPLGERDPMGHAVGVVLGRLAREGFEEVAVFSLRRAWRSTEKHRHPSSGLPNLRFFSAVRTLSEMPSFQGFLEALSQEDAA
ncbi:ATP-binding protein [Holophaga foetida]|uniref:ATP-binding protein n=1 Tax=Holophaga foetida TaxID=35839 RepID=UPI0002471C55|nr:AAA family ATPase [Holophaga foetida]